MISDVEKRLLAEIDRDELVELTRDLVRIDSVIRPESGGTEREVVRFIARWIRAELGVEPLVQEVEQGRENVIATLDSGRSGPCLMLEGHTDVVSEGNRDAWSHDPFGADVQDGEDLRPGILRHEGRDRRCAGHRQSAPEGARGVVRESTAGLSLR